jgi:hypothetical protein
MQVCARDWRNGLWTIFSLSHFAAVPFRLVILSQPPIGPEAKNAYRSLFPGVLFADEEVSDRDVCGKLESIAPKLLSMWATKRFFTLPKVIESSLIARNEKIVCLDPDVAFFQRPTELLEDLRSPISDFGCFNSVAAHPAHRNGLYAIDPNLLAEATRIELPHNFAIGLGVVAPSLYPWEEIDASLRVCNVLSGFEFMMDQTLSGIACAVHGFRRLPVDQYAIDPVTSLSGVVARHYYAKTRDLMYLEAIPFLRRLLKKR